MNCHRHALLAVAILIACPTWLDAEEPLTLPLVPSDLDAPDGIDDPCPYSAVREPRRFMVAWQDPPMDCEWVVVLHPKQMFLRTGCNNPNPMAIHWVTSLSPDQYSALVKYLSSYRGKVLVRQKMHLGYDGFALRGPKTNPMLPDNPTKEQLDEWPRRMNAAVNSNLRAVLEELNNGIPTSIQKLPLDATVSKGKGIRIGP